MSRHEVGVGVGVGVGVEVGVEVGVAVATGQRALSLGGWGVAGGAGLTTCGCGGRGAG